MQPGSPVTRFPFIDATHAAELLRVTRDDILGWIDEGRLKSYGGKDRNPFVRSSDVEQLAASLGQTAQAGARDTARSTSPVKRVQLRINTEARWAEISPDDIAAWARDIDPRARIAALRVIETAMTRLSQAQHLLDPSDNAG